jgi:vancomycin permeability regulator SanA
MMNNPFNMMGNPMQMIMQRFNQFRQTFQGDPQQQVQQMLNSGRVSQAQYNQAVQMANQLQRMMGIK